MSKTSGLQKIECLKPYLEQLKKGRKYQKPKTTMQDLVDVRIKHAESDED